MLDLQRQRRVARVHHDRARPRCRGGGRRASASRGCTLPSSSSLPPRLRRTGSAARRAGRSRTRCSAVSRHAGRVGAGRAGRLGRAEPAARGVAGLARARGRSAAGSSAGQAPADGARVVLVGTLIEAHGRAACARRSTARPAWPTTTASAEVPGAAAATAHDLVTHARGSALDAVGHRHAQRPPPAADGARPAGQRGLTPPPARPAWRPSEQPRAQRRRFIARRGRRAGAGGTARLRSWVTTSSAMTTTAKIANRTTATRSHWKRFIALSSAMPMPPAPTRPSTADSRTLMSQRNSAIDQNAGLTCGQ
jgi:hypothetical protein